MRSSPTPAYGWGPIGRRVAEPVPHGHGTTITPLAGLRSTGLIAPSVVDGAMNGALSRAYVRQHLAKELRPGDLVVMDNLPGREVAGVADAVRGAGAEVVYLPADRPDIDPIEQVFSKAKAEVRRREPRTVAATETLCGESLGWFSADECRNYIRHAGYGPQGSG